LITSDLVCILLLSLDITVVFLLEYVHLWPSTDSGDSFIVDYRSFSLIEKKSKTIKIPFISKNSREKKACFCTSEVCKNMEVPRCIEVGLVPLHMSKYGET